MVNSLYDNPPQRLLGIEDFELFGDEMYPIGIQSGYPRELKLYVLAAVKTYVAGNKSIDYMLKQYRSTWESKLRVPTPEQSAFDEILWKLKSEIMSAAKQFNTPVPRPQHEGLFAAEAAMLRLQISFRMAIFLAKQRQLFETVAVIRLIFEQLCWVYAIYKMPDESLYRVKSTNTISKFKEIFSKAGGFYGLLSELAHISPENTSYYIEIDGKKIHVKLNSIDTKWFVTYLLATTVDLYRIVTEHVLVDIINEFSSIIVEKDGKISINKRRSFILILDTIRGRVDAELSGI